MLQKFWLSIAILANYGRIKRIALTMKAGMLHTTAQLIIREVWDRWTYTGDGDTKTYQEVCKSKPHENVEIVKAESIGHVQKCVGSRLRSLKEKYKNQVLSDGKKKMFG